MTQAALASTSSSGSSSSSSSSSSTPIVASSNSSASLPLPRSDSEVERAVRHAVFAAAGLFDKDVEEEEQEQEYSKDMEIQTEDVLVSASSSPSSSNSRSRASSQVLQLHEQGIEAFNKQDYQQAQTCFSSALTSSLNCGSSGRLHYFSLLLKRSMCYSALHDYARALADADRASIVRPGSALAIYHRAVALQGLGKLTQAEQALHQACHRLIQHKQQQQTDNSSGGPGGGEEEESKQSVVPELLNEEEGDSDLDEEDQEMITDATITLSTLIAEMEDKATQLDCRRGNGQACLDAYAIKTHILMDWLRAGDCLFPYLHFSSCPETSFPSRAAYALTVLPADTTVLSIPISRIITYATVIESPVCRYLASHSLPHSFTHTYFACFLHYHLHYLSLSPWSEYLNTLPTLSSMSSFPVFYSVEEKRELEGCSVLSKLTEMIKEMKGEYDLTISCLSPPSLLSSVTSIFFPSTAPSSNSTSATVSPASRTTTSAAFSPARFLASFSFNQYLYYRCLILSRVFTLPLRSAKQEMQLCLAPGADSLNHYAGPVTHKKQARWSWDQHTQRLLIHLTTDVEAADEIQHDYGPKDNNRWLLHYGMIPYTYNPHSTVTLTLSVPGKNSVQMERRTMLAALTALSTPITTLPIDFSLTISLLYSHQHTQQAFAALRIYVAAAQQLQDMKAQIASHGSFDILLEPYNIEHELTVLQTLSEFAIQQLALYRTTLEEDRICMKALNRKETEPTVGAYNNLCNCLQLRIQEKEIWRWFVLLTGRIQVRLQRYYLLQPQMLQQEKETNGRIEAEVAAEAMQFSDHDAKTEKLLDDYWENCWISLLNMSTEQ